MKCLKCGDENFYKKTILVRRLDVESKYLEKDDIFNINICQECGLTQWYDSSIISGKGRPQRKYEKSIYVLPERKDFRCLYCASQTYITERIHTAGKGTLSFVVVLNPLWWEREWYGDIFLQVCANCGLTEVYEILLNMPRKHSALDVRKKIVKAGKEFKCFICQSEIILQSGVISFFEKNDYSRKGETAAHLFITCKKCRHMQIFDELCRK